MHHTWVVIDTTILGGLPVKVSAEVALPRKPSFWLHSALPLSPPDSAEISDVEVFWRRRGSGTGKRLSDRNLDRVSAPEWDRIEQELVGEADRTL